MLFFLQMRPLRCALVAWVASAAACSPELPRATARASAAASAPPPPPSASASAAQPPAPPPEPPHVTADAAEQAMFLGKPPEAAVACRARPARGDRIACQLEVLYAGDPKAKELALRLYRDAGSVAGLEVDHVMDGGYRGKLHLVPELPIGKERRHLEWVTGALAGFESFQAALRERGELRYRTRALVFKFLRSVKARTPSAYASAWSVGWNLSGSLHGSAAAVEETLWHEIFHLNDQEHENWSATALGGIYRAIYDKCGERTPCLAPYAPGDTMVRGGTYYAFHGDNGPAEYAAELAVRYWREHRAVLAKQKLPKKAFKCGPPENAKAWAAIAKEFFGGVDLVPAC